MPRIRDEVHKFIDLWNIYPIKANKARPNIVSKKLFRLYKKLKGGA